MDWQVEVNKLQTEDSFIDTLDLSEEEKPIFEYIATQECTTDEICTHFDIEFSDLTVALMELELKGYIKQSDGGKYMSVVKIL